MMTITIFTAPDGTEYRELPARYENTSPITEAWALAHGWTKGEKEVSDPPEIHTYSKLKLYDALVSANLWADVKVAIENAGQWERWELANELSTDYEPFALLLSQLRQTYGDSTTDSILESAEI